MKTPLHSVLNMRNSVLNMRRGHVTMVHRRIDWRNSLLTVLCCIGMQSQAADTPKSAAKDTEAILLWMIEMDIQDKQDIEALQKMETTTTSSAAPRAQKAPFNNLGQHHLLRQRGGSHE